MATIFEGTHVLFFDIATSFLPARAVRGVKYSTAIDVHIDVSANGVSIDGVAVYKSYISIVVIFAPRQRHGKQDEDCCC